jgi:hypothetical protein
MLMFFASLHGLMPSRLATSSHFSIGTSERGTPEKVLSWRLLRVLLQAQMAQPYHPPFFCVDAAKL